MNSEKICVVITPDLKKSLIELSKKKHISQNAIIRLAISEMIEREK